MAVQAIQAIATAISEGFKLLNQWNKNHDKRRMEAAIEAAEKFILTHEDKELEEKQKKKLLRKYRSRFFKYN